MVRRIIELAKQYRQFRLCHSDQRPEHRDDVRRGAANKFAICGPVKRAIDPYRGAVIYNGRREPDRRKPVLYQADVRQHQ